MRFVPCRLLHLRAFIYRLRYLVSLGNYAARCSYMWFWWIVSHAIINLAGRGIHTSLSNDFAYPLSILVILLHEEDKLNPELVVLTSFNLQSLLELLDTSMQSLHAVMRHRTLVTALASWAACPSKRFPHSFSSFYLLNMLLDNLSIFLSCIEACCLGAYRLIQHF